MKDDIEKLLTIYESGGCSRRQFIGALSALIASPAIGRAQPNASFVARGLNHVTLHVTDLRRSQEFYQQLFGLRINGQGEDYCNLGMGSTFLSLDASHHEATIDHFCIGIDGFDLQATKQKLASTSINATIENGNQLYFRDPDRLRVQVSSPEYRG